MDETVLLGRDQQLHTVPQATWEQHLHQVPQHSQTRLSFMTDDHHRVRYWVVRELVARLAHVRLPAAVTREAVSADGVPCEQLTPKDGPADRVLLYLHGGGFVYGLTPPHLEMVAYLQCSPTVPYYCARLKHDCADKGVCDPDRALALGHDHRQVDLIRRRQTHNMESGFVGYRQARVRIGHGYLDSPRGAKGPGGDKGL
jgi:hypothetical protein